MIKILIGCVNFHTKIFTKIWLDTLYLSIKKAGNQNIVLKDGVIYGPIICPRIVIVNNSPEEDLSDLKLEYKEKIPYLKWIDNIKNEGVAFAWNQIIKEGFDTNGIALFDYYVPANNDIYFTENWFENFTSCLSQDKSKEFGWISSCMNDYKEPELTGMTETLQVEGRYWGGLRPEADDIESREQLDSILTTVYAPFGGINKFSELLKNKYGLKMRQMHPKAPCFALSKECIKQVGLFDEYNSPDGLHEDADMTKRIESSPFKIGMAFGAYVHHFSMMSRTRNEYKQSWWVDSREKAFQEKWGVSSKEMHRINKDTTKFRLDIGSGERPKREDDKHWYHLDIDKKFTDIEFLQDISDLSNFEDSSIKEMYASNCLEHVEHRKILSTLFEWYRVLDFGGKIEIRVPNFRFAAERYLEGSWVLSLEEGVDLNLMHLVFGGDNEGCPHVHKVGLDFNNLSKALRDVGFNNVQDVSQKGSWELRLIAEK